MLADVSGSPVEASRLTGDMLTRAEIETAARYGVSGERSARSGGGATVSAAHPVYAHRFKLLSRVLPDALPWYLRYEWGRTRDPNGWNKTPAADASEVTAEERDRGTARTVSEYRDVMWCDLPARPAVAALRDTLALCRAEGIPVRLVVMPEGDTFRNLYPPGAEARIALFLASLTAEFGCPLTDARGWLPEDASLDGHHLHRAGAAAFTDRLTAEVILPFLHARAGRAAP